MSTVALPVAAPPGFESLTGQQITVIDPVTVNPATLSLPVASGEAWLMQTMSGFLQTTGGAGTRGITFRCRDQDGFVVWSVEQTRPVTPSELCTFAFGLGLPSQTMSIGGGTTNSSQGLPWVIASAGWKYELLIDGGIGADALQNLVHVYTKFDGGAGDGGGGSQLLGPFMLVPGQDTSVPA